MRRCSSIFGILANTVAHTAISLLENELVFESDLVRWIGYGHFLTILNKLAEIFFQIGARVLFQLGREREIERFVLGFDGWSLQLPLYP